MLQKGFRGRLGVALGLCVASLYLGGAALPQSEEDLRINIDIPKDDVEVADIEKLISGLNAFVSEGKTRVKLADVVAALQVDEGSSLKQILEDIVASREELADLDCSGRVCKVTTFGNELTFKLESINIPVLGVPVVTLGKRVDLFLEVSEDLNRLESCRIQGVKAKTGILNNNVDGFLIEKTDSEVTTLKIDAGIGGDYPKNNCRF